MFHAAVSCKYMGVVKTRQKNEAIPWPHFLLIFRDYNILIGRDSGIVGEIMIDANREIKMIRIL